MSDVRKPGKIAKNVLLYYASSVHFSVSVFQLYVIYFIKSLNVIKLGKVVKLPATSNKD